MDLGDNRREGKLNNARDADGSSENGNKKMGNAGGPQRKKKTKIESESCGGVWKS